MPGAGCLARGGVMRGPACRGSWESSQGHVGGDEESGENSQEENGHPHLPAPGRLPTGPDKGPCPQQGTHSVERTDTVQLPCGSQELDTFGLRCHAQPCTPIREDYQGLGRSYGEACEEALRRGLWKIQGGQDRSALPAGVQDGQGPLPGMHAWSRRPTTVRSGKSSPTRGHVGLVDLVGGPGAAGAGRGLHRGECVGVYRHPGSPVAGQVEVVAIDRYTVFEAAVRASLPHVSVWWPQIVAATTSGVTNAASEQPRPEDV